MYLCKKNNKTYFKKKKKNTDGNIYHFALHRKPMGKGQQLGME